MKTPSMSNWKHDTGIADLAEILRGQAASPADAVASFLRRIERLQPELNAFITVAAESATEDAQSAEQDIRRGEWKGHLHGIPVGIKDFFDTAGIRTTAAFARFKDRVPARDAAAVEKLKRAGAILVGKTNMHALGMGTTGLESFFGPVRNPWNPDFITGGSSSGSAAAVASGMCCAALDTDAVGSCRLPAACCGVVGFKGTYALIDLKGILEGEEPPGEEVVRPTPASPRAMLRMSLSFSMRWLSEAPTVQTYFLTLSVRRDDRASASPIMSERTARFCGRSVSPSRRSAALAAP